MPERALIGSRIRQRRIAMGVRQAALARQIGISASYLNLIEHNKRRIAGKLVTDFADALDTDVTSLSQGAEEGLVTALREAQSQYAQSPGQTPPLEPAEELTARFVGWSGLIAAQQVRIADLERSVEGLTDRITHDPFLSQSLHDVLSSVTSIRSTSSILRDSKDLEPDWQARFHNNLYEDAVRLADSSQNLVQYLDAAEGAEASVVSPLEEFEEYLLRVNFNLEEAADLPQAMSAEAHTIARQHAQQYQRDADALPLEVMSAALETFGPNPMALSQHFQKPFDLVLRRLASVMAYLGRAVGLVVCDASGTFTYRHPIEGFVIPRFGAACPLWPLFSAFTQPMRPIRQITQFAGRDAPRFQTYAVATTLSEHDYEGPEIYQATMLIVPMEGTETQTPDRIVGAACRICPQVTCKARREPSILEAQTP